MAYRDNGIRIFMPYFSLFIKSHKETQGDNEYVDSIVLFVGDGILGYMMNPLHELSTRIVERTSSLSTSTYTSTDQERMVYTLEAFLGDATKTLLLFMFFYAFGYGTYFVLVVMATMVLRTNMGGFHFTGYFKCLLFSSLYFLGMLLLYKLAIGPMPLMLILAGLSLIIQLLIVPVVTKERELVKSLNKKRLKLKSLIYSLLIILLHIIINNPYTLIALWVVLIQTLFISLYKGGKLYEKFHQQKR